MKVLTGADETDDADWTPCGSTLNMLDTTEWNYNIGYVNCGSTLIGSKVEITFDSDNGDF